MAEKETFTLTPQEQPNKDDFAAILAMQEADMRRSAQRIIEAELAETPAEQPIEGQMELPFSSKSEADANTPNKRKRGSKAVAAVVGVGVAAGLGAGFAAATAPDEFSNEKTSYIAENGDGLWDAAEEIEGSFNMNDAIDSIKGDPANIDVLKDGLQQGESIVIPVSTKDIEDQNK
ncbi:MAG: hypothetical protein ACREGE_01570 [Candidatus Microsaccharimonas sp.]